MREITREEDQEFLKEHSSVEVEGEKVELVKWGQIDFYQPEDFALEKTTVWSFEERIKWAIQWGQEYTN